MVASAVFVLDNKGKVLIARNYRGDVPMAAIEKFMTLVADNEEDGAEMAPIVADADSGIHFLYMKYSNLYRAHPLYPSSSAIA